MMSSASKFIPVVLVAVLTGCGRAEDAPPATSESSATPGSSGDPNSTSDQPPAAVPGSNPNPSAGARLVGRVDTANSAGPRFSWPNSAVVTTFQGTTLKVKMIAVAPGTNVRIADYYDVVVDSEAPRLLKLSPNLTEYTVCKGLQSGIHTVRVIKRTESRFSTGQLLGVETDDATGILPSDAPDRRIEFIGDSITAGYGTEATNPNDATCQVNRGENAELTYAALTAQALGAEFVNISWTGVGVLCPVNGKDTAAALYERALPTNVSSQWDFQWAPQVVVINLGTNDTTLAAANPSAFANAYGDLLAKVRGHYPHATIFCLLGTMLQGDDLIRIRAGVSAALQARASAGDAMITLLELAPDDGSRGYGCGFHPVAATHALMAAQLTQAVKASMGW